MVTVSIFSYSSHLLCNTLKLFCFANMTSHSILLFSGISYRSVNLFPLYHSSVRPVCFSGAVFSRFILTGVWKNLIDVLSTPLTGRMAGSSKGLAFILGAEGVKEQSQRERDTICLSLDGLRKAAALSCALGGCNICLMYHLSLQGHPLFSFLATQR